MNTNMKRLTLALCASSVIWTTGCGEKPAPVPSSTPVAQATVQATPTETPAAQATEDLGSFADQATKDKAAALADSHTENGFPADAKKVKENAPAFLYLAATAENEAIRHDALKQIHFSYTTSSKSDTQMTADANYDKVVLHYLKSSDPTELYYALQAASRALRKDSDTAIIDEIVKIGNNHPEAEGRHEALSAFASLGRRAEYDNVVDLYIKAFGDEPIVASEALYWCRGTFGRSAKAEEIKAAIIESLKSGEPGVRGRGIEALALEFPRDADLIIENATPLLKDESPFVRAKAADALGRSKDPRALALIAPLLDDPAETKHRLKFTNIMGKNDGILHNTFGWGRVDGTALKAMENISKREKGDGPKLKLGKVDYKTKDEDIAREVAAAKKWLAGRKG